MFEEENHDDIRETEFGENDLDDSDQEEEEKW